MKAKEIKKVVRVQKKSEDLKVGNFEVCLMPAEHSKDSTAIEVRIGNTTIWVQQFVGGDIQIELLNVPNAEVNRNRVTVEIKA